ncbi:hypothetical protein GDO81_014692 [Engystomops pustulosus]|uniref:G-protein coupled receptors family 1 profile domain-containing protein n=1 Tax=Engystomops pustulosus TaxID=76066 RepID=A0AAV7BBX2_ENGPU|nr:hypothetical protein GDO81_014692 [Engystomops pustulosus]
MSMTLYSTVFILGIIGNGLVIWIAGFRMKKTISSVWFLHLAIADFLCCASLPLRIAEWSYLLKEQVPMAASFCRSSIVLFNLNMSASVLLLTAMSVDRWVSVMWPFWAKVYRTHNLVRLIVGIIWGLSLLITGLYFYLYFFYFCDVTEWCVVTLFKMDSNRKQPIQQIRLVMMFVIPFLIIFTSYVTIFLKLRKSNRPQRSQRPYRIITAVILCFFICWAPYYIWPLTSMFATDIIQFFTINTIIINLACLNSCINPIIYVFMGQDFRHNFLRSIPLRLERALGEQSNEPYREQETCEAAPAVEDKNINPSNKPVSTNM